MKKLLFTFIPLLYLSSCQEQDADLIFSDQKEEPLTTQLSYSKNRSTSEAIIIAENAANFCYPASSRSNTRTASAENIKIITGGTSRSGNCDSLMYIINFDDNQGFAIVPIPRIEKEFLAVVERGAYDPAIGTDNPGFNYYIQAASEYIKNEASKLEVNEDYSASPLFEITPVNPDHTQIYKSQTDTLQKYGYKTWLGDQAWGQGTPYNKYCPNKCTGCVPTACAMIISSIRSSKNRVDYTFPEKDIDYEIMDWANMNKHRHNSPKSLYENHVCTSTYEAHNSIARLMRQIGVIAESKYITENDGRTKTSTKKSKCEPTLKFFLPDRIVSGWKDYNSIDVLKTLDWGYMLMATDGHAWVADGYRYLKTRFRSWDRDPDTWEWILKKDLTTTYKAVHMNWGWDGDSNGFFEGTVLDAGGYRFEKPQYISITYQH